LSELGIWFYFEYPKPAFPKLHRNLTESLVRLVIWGISGGIHYMNNIYTKQKLFKAEAYVDIMQIVKNDIKKIFCW
jgi:hypothetical protein